ncbi:hypothetical protein FRB91_007719 [Serendipita sp. 411]|nr:hypothetical protein FRB91_007719 [Serendipita sp. 411]
MHLHPVISAAESITEPPESFHIGSHRVDRAVCIMQDARLKLLTLCKALYPLAEELLYSRVILYGNSLESGSFQKAAMGFLSGGRKRRRGEATNLLLIDTFGVKDLSLHLDLGSLCPRLHILYLFGDISTINAKIDAGWSLGLKMLTLHSFQFKWHDLRVLSVCFPRLDVLKLSNPDIDTELDPTVIEKAVFPRLEFLVITIQSFGDIPIHNLELPCLRWLSVSVDEVQTDTGATVDAFAVIEALLQTCKKTLIGVELDIGPLLDYPQLCIDTFEIVPNLETLVCYFTIYYNDIVPEDVYSSMTPHNLKHLVIYTDNCNLLQRYLMPSTMSH